MKKVKKNRPHYGEAKRLFNRLESEVEDMNSRSISLAVSIPGLVDLRDNAIRIQNIIATLRRELIVRKVLAP